MNTLYLIVAFIFCNYFFKFLNKVLVDMDNKNSAVFNSNKFKTNLISRYSLSKFDSHKFQEFCYDFLISLGHSNIESIFEGDDGGITYSIGSETGTTYVHCFQARKVEGHEENRDDNFEKLGRPDIQKFVGNMMGDNVHSGIIITNGDFSEHALEYISNLPPEYSFQVFDGCNLSKTCWNQKFSFIQ